VNPRRVWYYQRHYAEQLARVGPPPSP
jgi:hypothetical protein